MFVVVTTKYSWRQIKGTMKDQYQQELDGKHTDILSNQLTLLPNHFSLLHTQLIRSFVLIHAPPLIFEPSGFFNAASQKQKN